MAVGVQGLWRGPSCPAGSLGLQGEELRPQVTPTGSLSSSQKMGLHLPFALG